MRSLGFLCCVALFASALGDDKKGAAPPSEVLTLDSALVTVIEEVEVPARVEGVLSSVEAREGKLVERGTLLAQLDDVESRLALERASVELEIATKQARSDIKTRVARKAAELAALELKRAKESVEKYKKSVSETELDRLRVAAEKAELDIEQTRHETAVAELSMRLKEVERDLARQAVERRTIVAPIDGVVVQVPHHAGEWVEPGKTVVRVLRIDPLRVECFVAAKHLSTDLTGRPAQFMVDLPGKPGARFEGRVSFVSPEVNPVNGQVRIWAEVPNPELRLRPGMQGKLTITSASAEALSGGSE